MSDWSRIQRQQAFFHAVINKANGEFPNLLAINNFLQATARDLQVDSGFSAREMISLGLALPRRRLERASSPRSCPPTATTIGGNDVLIAAQPYAAPDDLELPRASGRRIDDRRRLDRPRPTTEPAATTSPSATATTVPPSQVVFDNPKTLPEPWNPKPC